jgi:hypothetical protein
MQATREVESELQRFGEFILRKQLVRQSAAPYLVGWVRRFLCRPAASTSLADQVRGVCESLERLGTLQDWQVRQAESALQIYFVNYLGHPWGVCQYAEPGDVRPLVPVSGGSGSRAR